ncbi:MAG: PucR family transcriptional regulator ligand-binding domain-containing protein [Gudongella sp.]|nr:PucR family transcriptional regulator ligand-binding domain-containing protein [Gudongella sp.]
MGIQIKEILNDKYFREYGVIAGEDGLDREVQAVALFDAPDGYLWFKGKEFVLTTGFLFTGKTDYFKDVIRFLHKNGSAGMGIKKDRYLHEVSEEVIALCNELSFPLINIPYDEAWIDVINAVNSIAINRFITRVIDKPSTQSSITPKDLRMKIRDIIHKLSIEIKMPVTIIDVITGNSHTYPPIFESTHHIDFTENIGDYDFDFSKETICDKLNITRITPLDSHRCPWISIPVVLRGRLVRKIIIWESDEKIDYYSLLSIRIATALLTEILEQLYIYQNFEGRYYDDLVKAAINGELDSFGRVKEFLGNIEKIRVAVEDPFIVSCIHSEGGNINLINKREEIYKSVLSILGHNKNIYGIVDDDKIVILTQVDDTEGQIRKMKSDYKMILDRLNEKLGECSCRIGIGTSVSDILSSKRSFIESLKALEVGKYIYEDRKVVAFEDLGPFGLLRLENIQRRDFGSNFDKIMPLLNHDNSKELLETLKVYLESESNFNVASNKLFLHTNTVRYRIAKIQEMCDIDLDDPVERLKTEITLKFLELIR